MTTQIVAITKGTNFGTKDNCSTRTVCLDYVDSCGQTAYDGGVPDCKPVAYFLGSRLSFEAYYCHTLFVPDTRGAKTVEAVEAAVATVWQESRRESKSGERICKKRRDVELACDGIKVFFTTMNNSNSTKG